MIRQMRKWLRDRFIQLLQQAFATNDGQEILGQAIASLGAAPPHLMPVGDSPYPELQFSADGDNDRPGVFVTGRFRSGSTLLWNIFRQTSGVTAYYEPLNERRWFDRASRGSHTDVSHKNVADYWREYDGLSRLSALYDENWIRRRLYLSERCWMPDLESYIQSLLEAAEGVPVLQFNRVDFRLPWLRARFPNSKIIHLYRHPRDQWISTFRRFPVFPRAGTTSEFALFDEFYLLSWCQDLKHVFPFLDPAQASHPYELHYLLWRLSYQFGKTFAHHSLRFEDLIDNPLAEITELFSVLELDRSVDGQLLSVIDRPQRDKWRDYADESWFAEKEARCERVIAQFFQSAGIEREVQISGNL
jgi:hypothetical protein